MSASVRRAGRMGRRVGARVAALVLGAALVALAPVSRAAVTVFVNNSATGTVNRYVDGVLTGQLPAEGSGTSDDKARNVDLGPTGLIYVDRLSGSSIQGYNPSTLAATGPAYTINSNGGASFGTGPLSFGGTNMYVDVMSNNTIQRIDTATGIATNLVAQGSGGLAVPKQTLVVGNTLYVSAFKTGNGNNGDVLQYDATTGQFQGELIPAGQNGLLGPVGLALAPDGNLLVSGYNSDNILKFSRTGQFLSNFVSAIQTPADMQINLDDGNLYVTSTTEGSVREYNGLTGGFMGFAVAPGAGGLSGAASLAVFGSSASAVPLPSGAWAGIVTLGLLAAGYGVQRRRAMA